MVFPPGDTPLYNHSLPVIEKWLKNLGCQQDTNNLNRWEVERFNWKGEISLEIEGITVRYLKTDGRGREIQRSFKYSLSRQDIEAAIFEGP